MPSFAVIGGGFGGINACIQIQIRFPNVKVVLFEQGDQLGGAWHWNRYPGAGCDIPSHLHSLSVALKSDWDDHYPSSDAIRKYLENVAVRFGVYRVARLQTHVSGLTWQDNTNQWKLESYHVLASEDIVEEYYDYVISATGPLHVPKYPSWHKEQSVFKGQIVHTARWPATFSTVGKRIAVIGTGASAVQVIPELHKTAASLVIFQRHATWVNKKKEYKYSSIAKWIFKYIPYALKLWRLYIYLGLEFGYTQFLTSNPFSRLIHASFRSQLIKVIHQAIPKDPLKQKLATPTYAPGARRVCVSNTYLETIGKQNVTVIHGDSVVGVTETGVVTEGGLKVPVDVIVLATGFELVDVFQKFKVVGRRGNMSVAPELGKVLIQSPKAYKGTMVPSFPNLFTILGPNLGFGHMSVLLPMEWQTDWLLRVVEESRKAGRDRIEVTREACDTWNAMVQKGFEGGRTVWSVDKGTYYWGKDGENFTLWPYSSIALSRKFREAIDTADFVQ